MIHFKRMFHYKPSILGYPIYGNPPFSTAVFHPTEVRIAHLHDEKGPGCWLTVTQLNLLMFVVSCCVSLYPTLKRHHFRFYSLLWLYHFTCVVGIFSCFLNIGTSCSRSYHLPNFMSWVNSHVWFCCENIRYTILEERSIFDATFWNEFITLAKSTLKVFFFFFFVVKKHVISQWYPSPPWIDGLDPCEHTTYFWRFRGCLASFEPHDPSYNWLTTVITLH